MKKSKIIYPVIFMFVLTAVLTAGLAWLNEATADGIAENLRYEKLKKILYVFDYPEEVLSNRAKVEEIMEHGIEIGEFQGRELFVLKENGMIQAYAVPFTGPGLWGTIEGYLGITSDFSKVTGVEFITQSETPGLGGRIGEEFYKMQYRGVELGKDAPYIINRPQPGGNVDAITGATLTSAFVTDMINKDVKEFLRQIGGERP